MNESYELDEWNKESEKLFCKEGEEVYRYKDGLYKVIKETINREKIIKMSNWEIQQFCFINDIKQDEKSERHDCSNEIVLEKNIKKYIQELLDSLTFKDRILAVLVYGSSILKLDDEFSDIDVLFIVAENNIELCGRGNKIINEKYIEYFIKTENIIYQDLLNELDFLEPVMQTALLLGVVYMDKDGIILRLRERAKKIKKMPYRLLSQMEIESITTTLKNQLKEINRKNKHKEEDLLFCYHIFLYELIKAYCDFKRIPIRKYKFYETYTNESYRKKYMQLDIEDIFVKKELLSLIEECDIVRLNELVEYILKKINN